MPGAAGGFESPLESARFGPVGLFLDDRLQEEISLNPMY